MMIMTFWGGVMLSFLFLLEGMDEKKKIMTFWGGVMLSFLFLLEGMEYEQNFWDFNLKYPLIFLTLTLLPPTLLSFNQKIFLKNSGKSVVVFICFLLLSLVFWVESFWLFFLFFEISVIPIILMITESGSSKNRLEASKFLFFFTSGSSLIFLIFLIWSMIQGWEMSSWNSFTVMEFNNSLEVFLSLLAILTFFVKMPSLFLHMWLPKAHVEAPVFGSMVLASVMLKMGGYGIILFSPLIDFFFSSMISSFFFILFSFYSAFLCYGQKDLNCLFSVDYLQQTTKMSALYILFLEFLLEL
nr:NADH dehydrogenase subunit 4 [Heterochaerus australis]